MKFLIFVFLFLIVSGLIFINNYNLHLVNKKELKTFSELYYNWFSDVYSNIFVITGDFSKLNWVPS